MKALKKFQANKAKLKKVSSTRLAGPQFYEYFGYSHLAHECAYRQKIMKAVQATWDDFNDL